MVSFPSVHIGKIDFESESTVCNRTFGLFLAIFAWILNPAYLAGCGGQAGFTFGEADMLELMETVEESAWDFERFGNSYTLAFSLEQSAGVETTSRMGQPLLSTAFACEDRTFLAAAHACMDMSRLEVEGTVDVIDYASGESILDGLAVQGEMSVVGQELSNASLNLVHDGGEFRFNSADGLGFVLDHATW